MDLNHRMLDTGLRLVHTINGFSDEKFFDT